MPKEFLKNTNNIESQKHTNFHPKSALSKTIKITIGWLFHYKVKRCGIIKIWVESFFLELVTHLYL